MFLRPDLIVARMPWCGMRPVSNANINYGDDPPSGACLTNTGIRTRAGLWIEFELDQIPVGALITSAYLSSTTIFSCLLLREVMHPYRVLTRVGSGVSSPRNEPR